MAKIEVNASIDAKSSSGNDRSQAYLVFQHSKLKWSELILQLVKKSVRWHKCAIWANEGLLAARTPFSHRTPSPVHPASLRAHLLALLARVSADVWMTIGDARVVPLAHAPSARLL
ncbi:hypothetical protein DFH06DRAFT_1324568 [Mycena polygramma]|nr:hypothetical protein DFH06DRAFT_1324568 [Mycena polygramma]